MSYEEEDACMSYEEEDACMSTSTAEPGGGACPTMSSGTPPLPFVGASMLTMRVLCFGDSLTAGYWENGRRFHPYAHEATNLLGGVKIDHVGLCGYAPCPPLRGGAVARDAAETATEAAAARREAAGVCCHQLPLCAPPLPCVGH